MNSKNITLALIISIAILSRLIYHPPNFTPMFSVCIFAGMMFKQKRLMFLVPFLCMFISDLIIGLHNTLLFVYLSFAIVILLGKTLNENYSFSKLFLTIFTSNLVFFIIICVVTRGSRFFLVSYLTYKFGEKFGPFLEKEGTKWSIIITFFLLIIIGTTYFLLK